VNARDTGFVTELIKLGGLAGLGGGLLKKTVGLAAKHPLKALGVGMIVAPTALAYQNARKQGLEGGEKPRYLAAGRDESGRIRASEAAYTNYHDLFEHKPHPREVRALSKNYKPEAFSRVTAKPKEK
jgi:hypothetical protein